MHNSKSVVFIIAQYIVNCKNEHVKCEKIGRGRIAVGDALKGAIVFFILPSNQLYAKPTQLCNVWLSKLSNENHATSFVAKSASANGFLYFLFCTRK